MAAWRETPEELNERLEDAVEDHLTYDGRAFYGCDFASLCAAIDDAETTFRRLADELDTLEAALRAEPALMDEAGQVGTGPSARRAA